MQRRSLLGGLAGAAVGATFGSRPNATTLPEKLDKKNKSHLGLLQKKLIYAMDNRPLIWWIRGNKYGSINGELTPLWTLNVILFKSVSHNEDGAFDAKSMEIVYKTDVKTDEPLSKWRNPYNGEVYDEEPLIMGPLSRRFTDDGPISQTDLPGADIKRSGSIGPAEISGDDVWLISDTQVVLNRKGQKSFRANDLSTYHGKVSDVLDPTNPSPASTMTVHIVQSWHPWMNMGDQEGTLITRLSGAKCFDLEDIHPRILTMVKRYHPKIAKDFVARLDGPPERFYR